MVDRTMDLQTALAHHQAGRLADAEAACRRLLSVDPTDADAAQLLGVICLQTGRADEAVERLRFALHLRPQWAEAYNNLGVALDWRISDAMCDVPGETEAFHTEKLMRLPVCAFCYLSDEAPAVGPLPAIGRGGAITLGMLNRPAKITPAGAALWATVLRETPGSRLHALSPGGEDNTSLREQLEAGGVDRARLTLVPTGTRDHFLGLAREVDVLLDPFRYNGMTTTCDFLWMGVPTVTLAGTSSVSRTGASILRAVGLGDLVARTPDEYVHIARSLASDLPTLAALRLSLRDRVAASPLVDGPALTARLESAYRSMWTGWLAAAR